MNFIEILDLVSDFYMVFISTIVFVVLLVMAIKGVVTGEFNSDEENCEEEIADEIADRLSKVMAYVEYRLYGDEKLAFKAREEIPDDEKNDID